MIIFGWRTRPAVEATGTFDCPVCARRTSCALTRSRTWFTLFFVPVFPLSGSAKQSLICGECQTVLDPSLAAGGAGTTRSQINPTIEIQSSRASTNPLSVISLILGLVSFPAILACFLSILTSVLAIVTGHLALWNLKNSKEQGKALAIGGLSLGYFSLVLSIGALSYLLYLGSTDSGFDTGGNSPETMHATSASERLRSAESKIMSQKNGVLGRGNTPQAADVAERFAKRLKLLSDETFTGGSEKILDLTGGEFLTYCELHEDHCAFLVHVPSYKEYRGEVRELLSALAWTVASKEVGDLLEHGDRMAVAMRGTILYGDILVGEYTGVDDAVPPLDGERADLFSFFPRDPSNRLNAPNLKGYSEEGRTDLAAGAKADSLQNEMGGAQVEADALPQDSTGRDGTALGNNSAAADNETSSTGANANQLQGEASKDREETLASNELLRKRSDPFGGPAPAVEPRNRAEPTTGSPRANRGEANSREVFENRIPIQLVQVLDASGWGVESLRFVNQDQWLLAGRMDGTLTVFDTQSGEKRFVSNSIKELSQIVSLGYCDGTKSVLLGGGNGATGVMQIAESGELSDLQLLYRHSREARALAVNSRYRFLISGGQNGTLAWQPFDGRASSPKILQVLERQVLDVFLPASGDVAMATDGQRLIVFSLRSSQIQREFNLSKSYPHAAGFSSDGRRLVVSYGSEVVVFDTTTGSQLGTYQQRGSGIQWNVGFHPNQPDWLLTGGRGVVTIWDVDSTERVAVLDSATILYIKTFEFSQDGKILAMVPSAAGQDIRLFRVGD